jgi:hypothetical protein
MLLLDAAATMGLPSRSVYRFELSMPTNLRLVVDTPV